jgi:hypothetical protein
VFSFTLYVCDLVVLQHEFCHLSGVESNFASGQKA